MMRGVIAVNDEQRSRMVAKIARSVDRDLAGPRPLDGISIGALGLTFKAGTDDLRESPSLAILSTLQEAGAMITAYDPTAAGDLDHVQQHRLEGLRLVTTAQEVAHEADALVILTEWPEFAALDLDAVAAAMRGTSIVDTRNILDPASVRAAGLVYDGVGRS